MDVYLRFDLFNLTIYHQMLRNMEDSLQRIFDSFELDLDITWHMDVYPRFDLFNLTI